MSLLYADLVTGGSRISAILHMMIQEQLADMAQLNAADPAFIYRGSQSGTGSAARNVPIVDASGEFASVADGVALVPIDPTMDSFTLTIARKGLARELSDLGQITGAPGLLTLEWLAMQMATAYGLGWTRDVAQLGSSFTGTVGTTATPASLSDFQDGQFLLLEAGTRAELCVLDPKNFGELAKDTGVGTAGAIEHRPDAQAIPDARAPGFQGSLYGTRLWTSTRVDKTAGGGADNGNMILGTGAIQWIDGATTAVQGFADIVLPAGARMIVERQRDALSGKTAIVGSGFWGVGISEDGRGIQWICGT